MNAFSFALVLLLPPPSSFEGVAFQTLDPEVLWLDPGRRPALEGRACVDAAPVQVSVQPQPEFAPGGAHHQAGGLAAEEVLVAAVAAVPPAHVDAAAAVVVHNLEQEALSGAWMIGKERFSQTTYNFKALNH